MAFRLFFAHAMNSLKGADLAMRKQVGQKQSVIDGAVHTIRVFSPRRSRRNQRIRVRERMGDWQHFANHPNVRMVSQPLGWTSGLGYRSKKLRELPLF